MDRTLGACGLYSLDWMRTGHSRYSRNGRPASPCLCHRQNNKQRDASCRFSKFADVDADALVISHASDWMYWTIHVNKLMVAQASDWTCWTIEVNTLVMPQACYLVYWTVSGAEHGLKVCVLLLLLIIIMNILGA